MRVLIIEDDMILALSLEIMLKKMGYSEIRKAHTGEKALETIVDFEPDLMLVDIFLGTGISGIDVVKKVQERKKVDVIYITGNSDEYHRKQAGETDYLSYLVKPITYTELKKVLEKDNAQ
ncbi:response regulator [Rhodohalobacter halophilus]|uniref:response regulator n=1 Tax=Rhodohalobacter halophilus TaxID=1812810 RepID=UPI00083FA841|nr:response regulator [Rhodohalobacter halophilus]